MLTVQFIQATGLMQKERVTESLHTAAELNMTVTGKMTVLTVTAYIISQMVMFFRVTGLTEYSTVTEYIYSVTVHQFQVYGRTVIISAEQSEKTINEVVGVNPITSFFITKKTAIAVFLI